jgi:tetratricopeptide (TPR) repeat protein
LKKDRNNPDAWHGSGLCYQGMGNRDVAVERLEKAVTLYDPPSRAAVYNCAAANLRDNPMRAAKLVKDYLAHDPNGQDEAMHTLLGRALFSANRQARQNKYYAEVQEFYFGYMEKVNATRTDGRKRWGGEWVPGPVATERWNRYRGLQQNVEKLRVVVDHDTKAKTDAWDRFNDMRNAFRLVGEVEMKQSRERYEAAAKQEIASRQHLKAAEAEFNSAEKPPFPQIVKPIPMDPMSPGALLGK